MRKWAGVGALAAVLAAGGIYGIGAVDPAEAASSSDAGTKPVLIGQAKAKQYALAAVGGRGTVDGIELERSNGVLYYEVEIEFGRQDKDVLIDAYNGSTLDIRDDDDDDSDDDSEARDRAETRSGAANQGSSGQPIKSGSGKAVITSDQAVTAAKAEVGGTLHKVKLDREDGRLIYEVELRVNGKEVELDVDAYTGEIRAIEEEDDEEDN